MFKVQSEPLTWEHRCEDAHSPEKEFRALVAAWPIIRTKHETKSAFKYHVSRAVARPRLAGREKGQKWEGPGNVRPGRLPVVGGYRPHLGVRLHHAQRHSAQRNRADADFPFLVRSDEPHRGESSPCGSGRSVAAAARTLRGPTGAAHHDREEGPAAADRMRRARLSGRLRLEGISRRPDRLRHPVASRPDRIFRVAGADFYSRHQSRHWP